MASYIQTDCGVLIGKLCRGDDLLESLTEVAREKGFILGQVTAIGAVENAKVAYYNQKEKTYTGIDLNGRYEILNLTGTLSLKDQEVMLHAHITLSDENGRAFGGHLLQGTSVFACEFSITPFVGPELNRGFDEETGLPQWYL
jgi:predicted DNA-binding protein with PD1-like motif